MVLRGSHSACFRLSTACLVLIAILTLFSSLAPNFAQVTEVKPEFEIASVKRNLSGSRPWLASPVGGRFTAINIPLRMLIGVGWRRWRNAL
jgi:hypothetical protein